MNNYKKALFSVLFLFLLTVMLITPLNLATAECFDNLVTVSRQTEYLTVPTQTKRQDSADTSQQTEYQANFATKEYQNNLSVSSKSAEYQKYKGTIHHIFFHSLILDTEKAFHSKMKQGYNLWMTTRKEFKAILEKLYAEQFVLVDLTSLISLNSDGTVTAKPLYLPEGKKALVISVDDVNYYEYMKNDGFASRLTLDSHGRVCNIVKKNGKELLDYEGDVVPILDDFVKKHPDFSPFGAKGILAVTGYEGVFGYRTNNLLGSEKLKAQDNVRKIAAALKRTGWHIASHSYSHNGKFRNGSITLEKLQLDTQKWENEVKSLIGETPIFISPFGCNFSPKEDRFHYLRSRGFYIFCPIYKEMTLHYGKDYMISNRLNFDGLTMLKYPERIEKYFFDPVSVVDLTRKGVPL